MEQEMLAVSTQDANDSQTGTQANLKVDLAWFRLSEIFGDRWFGTYGEDAPQMWARQIMRLSNEQIAAGLDALSTKVNEQGQAYMPNLPEFVNACKPNDPYAGLSLPAPEEPLIEARRSAIAAGADKEAVMAETDLNELHFMQQEARFGRSYRKQ